MTAIFFLHYYFSHAALCAKTDPAIKIKPRDSIGPTRPDRSNRSRHFPGIVPAAGHSSQAQPGRPGGFFYAGTALFAFFAGLEIPLDRNFLPTLLFQPRRALRKDGSGNKN
ncbi:hypothetical protein [Herbaspirillum lusitanum]|uniref:hypothetical protein n=1 Tax=Herbaspirillum lusitanum TaxID=213312 RepID=UPI0012F5202A|nr:hypothetical protein [Herbaspirillum lusitanum]